MINPKLTKLPLDEPQTQTFQKSERELKGKYGRLYLPAENQEFLYKQPNLLFQLWDSLRSSAEYTVFILQTGPGTAEYLSACNDVWIHARRVFIASVELLVVLSNDVNKAWKWTLFETIPGVPGKAESPVRGSTCVACARGPVGHSRGHAVPVEGGVGQRQHVGGAQGRSRVAVDQAVVVAHRDWDGHVIIRLGDGL